MRRPIIFVVVLSLTAGIVFGRIMHFDHKRAPRLALPDAYNSAIQTLGSVANEYHCVGAGLLIHFSPDGEWLFTFISTNGAMKRVTVEFDKKTHIEDGDEIDF